MTHADADVRPTQLGPTEAEEVAALLSPLLRVKRHLSPSVLLLRDLDVTGCR
jgi:hypothetical protein